MSEYIVEMKNITKRFPGIVANDDVTIQIKKGEVYALLGENGAGKSTLMSMLFGMYEPDEGEIYVRGKREIISSPNYAASLYIGMVHQHFKLVSNYTIAENIIMGTEPMKQLFGLFPCVDIKSANEEIARLSVEYGLDVNPTKRICDVPVSVRQRVEILKMLYREADILIFDEPTAVLTPQEIEFLLNIIRGLKEAGKTVILITHKLEEIKKVADRCAILNRGKLVDVLDVKTTTTTEMASKMVGRDVSFEREKGKARYGEEVLSVQHLTIKDENRFDVVKNVSFTVRRGEIVAVAGVAGNGQVELADAIAGIKKASSGKIMLNGREITNDTIRGRIRTGISYIPEDRQSYGLVLDFPLCDNLVLKQYDQEPYARKGIRNQQEVQIFSERLQRNYDIRSARGNQTIVRSMSGGNQQKAIIAREVEQDSSLIIFVQPTRGLDVGAIHNIHNQILAERDKGNAILLISLELDEIMALADTIAVMYNGQILKCADATSLSVDEVGRYMMGGGKCMKLLKKYEGLVIPLVALFLSVTVAGVIIAFLGKNPFEAFGNFLQGSGILPKLRYAGGKNMLTDFCSFLNYWTPMIFAALGVAVALKAGLFNIAVSGQMLAAGFASTIIVGYSSLDSVIAKPLVIFVSITVGGAVGVLIGWLKYRFNINEVVSSIMINYIVQYVVAFFINMYYVDPVSRQSRAVSDASRLTLTNVDIGGYKYDIPIGMILALVVAIVIRFVFEKTTFGYELRAVGLNRQATQYAGIHVGKTIVSAMFISGALSGLAGATYYLGYFASIQPKVLASTGYDSIAVALLGNSNPIGILFASFLISVIGKGSTYMSSTAGLDAELSSVIISLILLFSACSVYIRHCIKKVKDKVKTEVGNVRENTW